MMMFSRLTIAAWLLSCGVCVVESLEGGSIGANTPAGRRLLKKARRVVSSSSSSGGVGRHLEEGDYDYYEGGEDDEDYQQIDPEDDSWIAKMSLKYEGCYNTVTLANGNNNYNNNNNNNNKNNNNNNNKNGGSSPVYNAGVITFKFCANNKGKCGSCMGGVYAVDMMDFMDAYTEAALDFQEYQCEKARENSGCDYDSDDQDACEQKYWYSTGMDYCVQEDQDDNAFELQRYLECAYMDVQNNNNNGNNYNNAQNAVTANGYQVYSDWDGAYRIGPYCAADGISIYLGVFYDASCSVVAGDGAYATLNSAQLPYSASSQTSIIPPGTCMQCIDQQSWDEQAANYNGNQNKIWANMEPLDFCLNAYETSVRCTADDRSGCGFINKYLKALSGETFVRYVGAPNNNAAIVFAWLFATTTFIFGAYTFYLFRKIKRGEVDIDYTK